VGTSLPFCANTKGDAESTTTNRAISFFIQIPPLAKEAQKNHKALRWMESAAVRLKSPFINFDAAMAQSCQRTQLTVHPSNFLRIRVGQAT
jgi:hypothetical protein